MIIKIRHINLLTAVAFLSVFFACGNSKKIQSTPTESSLPFKEAFHKANSEKLIGHYESAIKLYNKCIVLKPSSAASHFALASIYKTQKKTEKAIEYGRNAHQIDPKNKWYVAFLANTYFNTGDYHNSAKFYDQLIDQFNDRNLENQSMLAQSYIYSNQKEKAIKTLDIMEIETGSTPMTSLTKHDLHMELGNDVLAKQSLQNLFEDNPTSIEIGLEAMDYFLQTRQLEKASMAIEFSEKINPVNPRVQLGKAEIHLSKGNIDQTFELLKLALPSSDIVEKRKLMILESLMGMGFDNRYPEAKTINLKLTDLMDNIYPSQLESGKFMSLYGRYLMQNNKSDSARLFFEKAVNIDPNDYQSWSNLMDADYANNQYKQLLTDADKALNIFPNQPMIYLLKGIAEYELKRFDDAEETLFTGKQLVIEDKVVLSEFDYHLAKNYWRKGDKPKSSEAFENLFQANSGNARFLYGYAVLLESDNNPKKAIQYAKKAAEIDQANASYSALYANLLFGEKNYQLAQKMIERAINLDLDNPKYIEKYGDIMFFLGNVSKAVDIWMQADKILPSDQLSIKIKSKSYHD
ncbi:MAG: tetratricopeptide repeat protein [Crocinitomicaceae bacterium]